MSHEKFVKELLSFVKKNYPAKIVEMAEKLKTMDKYDISRILLEINKQTFFNTMNEVKKM